MTGVKSLYKARATANDEVPAVAEIEIYTSPFCGFCHAAKKLLEKKGVAFTEIDVMMSFGKRKEMTERSGGKRSVPQIFVDGEHLGDCMEIMEMDADDELDARLGL
jgi:glutaredoxin 3